MKFYKNKCLKMNEKVHYKMYKSGKLWLIAGITTFGLGVGGTLVKADSKAGKIQIQKKLSTSDNIRDKELLNDNVNMRTLSDSVQNYSQEQSFSQQFNNGKLSSVPVKTGAIKAGTDHTGALQLTYFNGRTGESNLVNQYGGTRGRSTWGEVSNARGSEPIFMAPNFSIKKGNGEVWSWVFHEGDLSTSSPFIAGINNDWKTADKGTNWRIWSIEQGPTTGMVADPQNPAINTTINMKFSGDFTFGTDKTYTLDFNLVLKPNGSTVDYGFTVRNVTALVNPGVSANDATLPGFWFGSQYDTMLGNNDYVPLYYTGANQGVYLKHGGYKLKFNFTSKDAPTGWGAGRWRREYSSVGIDNPSAAGQRGLNAPKDSVAYSGGDSALYMVWKAQDFADGDSRSANYQASISSETAVLPEIKLDKDQDNYTGGPYRISGKVTYKNPQDSGRPLKYFYQIDREAPVEFQGPQHQDENEHPFEFTIPAGQMEIGNEHSVSVYAVDSFGSSSETKFIKLTAHAELKTKSSEYFVGDKFDKFSCFDGGERVDGTPITSTDISDVKVKNAAGQEVNLNDVTNVAGKYSVTYTYSYGSGDKGGSISATGEVNVYAADDPRHGADFSLRDKIYYVGDSFNADNGFVSGRKNGTTPMVASDLTHTITNEIDGRTIADNEATQAIGDYQVHYKYFYGNNHQFIEKLSNVKVIDAKHITINYVDEAGEPIDERYLSGVSDAMKKGDHFGPFGSEFNITPAPRLDNAYEFVKAEQNPDSPAPIPNNKLVFGESNQAVNLVYRGVSIGDNDANAVTVHHYLKDRNGRETTTPVPGMQDIHLGGRVGQKLDFRLTDPEQKAPEGYELAPGQTDQSWILRPDQGKVINFYYKGKEASNIKVHFVNARNNKEVFVDQPVGHTGEELDLQGSSSYIASVLGKSQLFGYHYAYNDELNGKTQPTNPTYTTNSQDVTVYIAGGPVSSRDPREGAVVIHHYLEGTTTPVPGLGDENGNTYRSGYVGDEITIAPTDPEHQAPNGYTIVPNQETVNWTLRIDQGKEITYYYTPNETNNIKVHFVNAKNNKEVLVDQPVGHTGEELNLKVDSDYIKGQFENNAQLKGYHYASGNELNGKSQPNNPKYTTENQDVTVYVAGDEVDGKDFNKGAVIVHHYLEGTTTPVPGLGDANGNTYKSGLVGDEVTIAPTDPEHQAPNGYTIVPNQETVNWTLRI
ncbi:KxYKxGKxW signal peptide domain-containing protein, partial [Lactobacillus sp.]|uniref:KxYKxGKxW signal peptide domain-containing protein n=1 Tax=Lactobacillus sp. TaxID=1591 RepID=UPI0025874C18